MNADDYCRDIEAHLCRRNQGHLVRIVGPAFDTVRRWAEMGIPLKVAFQGIDRYVERATAKGPRRRPVRIEFCEADVLDAFDAWRRAVGVRDSADRALVDGVPDDTSTPARRAPSTHLDRVIARLTALRSGSSTFSQWDAAVDRAVRRLDGLRAPARRARGADRDRLIAELAAIDAEVTDAARQTLKGETAAEIAREADLELEPFRERMEPSAFAAAHKRCADRLLRESLGLPAIAVE